MGIEVIKGTWAGPYAWPSFETQKDLQPVPKTNELVKKTNPFEPSKFKTKKDFFGSNGYLCSVDDCHWAVFGGFYLGEFFTGGLSST